MQYRIIRRIYNNGIIKYLPVMVLFDQPFHESISNENMGGGCIMNKWLDSMNECIEVIRNHASSFPEESTSNPFTVEDIDTKGIEFE